MTEQYFILLNHVEPDLYSSLNTTITSQQVINNFRKLLLILKNKNYSNIFIAGPDVATLSKGHILLE